MRARGFVSQGYDAFRTRSVLGLWVRNDRQYEFRLEGEHY